MFESIFSALRDSHMMLLNTVFWSRFLSFFLSLSLITYESILQSLLYSSSEIFPADLAYLWAFLSSHSRAFFTNLLIPLTCSLVMLSTPVLSFSILRNFRVILRASPACSIRPRALTAVSRTSRSEREGKLLHWKSLMLSGKRKRTHPRLQ
uniref:Uncharacterized protein n=1 Tax=Encephalitozoon cuniculi TaxID=6035 RepID=M1JIF0_ENCCN|nr:hypothetical protein ECU08_1460 [Encephalitozoon cuniculi]